MANGVLMPKAGITVESCIIGHGPLDLDDVVGGVGDLQLGVDAPAGEERPLHMIGGDGLQRVASHLGHYVPAQLAAGGNDVPPLLLPRQPEDLQGVGDDRQVLHRPQGLDGVVGGARPWAP